MSTVLPPPPSPQPVPTAGPVVSVTVSSPPAAVAQLAPGAVVTADITQTLTRGLVEAQTQYGVLQLRTSLALAQGARIELQLLRALPQVQFAVRTIDGHAVPGPRPPAWSPPRQAGTVVSATGGSPAPVSGAAAAVVTPTSAPTTPLTVGSVLRATLYGQSPSASPAGAPVPGGGPASGTFIAPGDTPIVSANGPPPSTAAPSTTPVEVRILGMAAPGQPQIAATAGSAQPGAIDGTVTALAPSGRPVVQTPLGPMILDAAPAELRLGTQLRLSLAASLAPNAAPADTTRLSDPLLQSRSWPALDEAIAHLAQRAPASAPMPLQLPQANHRLAASLLFFLNALRGGDGRTWLGDAAAILDSERPDLARRVNDEFAQLARIFNETPSDDWRTATIPFFNGLQLAPVDMHIRGGKSHKDDKQEDEGSRFIIDVELSRLGRIQLDGFIKTRGKEKKSFDLIVRTAQPLPQRMRHDINQIFTGFGEAAGLTGLIAFQARVPFVEVPVLRIGHADGLVV